MNITWRLCGSGNVLVGLNVLTHSIAILGRCRLVLRLVVGFDCQVKVLLIRFSRLLVSQHEVRNWRHHISWFVLSDKRKVSRSSSSVERERDDDDVGGRGTK